MSEGLIMQVPLRLPIWVLVCDGAKARLFEVHPGDRTFHPVELLLHAESRKKVSDLVSDHAGSCSSEGASVHHNALAPRTSPKAAEKEHFAHSLVLELDRAGRSGRFGKWILVAPPHFLGLMRNELTSELQKHLKGTVDKDLNDIDAVALADRLHEIVVSHACDIGDEGHAH
jgi:protein required for attachment to host cells